MSCLVRLCYQNPIGSISQNAARRIKTPLLKYHPMYLDNHPASQVFVNPRQFPIYPSSVRVLAVIHLQMPTPKRFCPFSFLNHFPLLLKRKTHQHSRRY
ncbi:hypothetical protein TRIATDRAFT_300937 [Trichoderma atroviride IMI 206040]|uniref:Uncharacterized protein n=1 Tax=Hypocrea atroviridis (strain ATCC 20476 / IMI 206040) TaxID=452589 RepID=G9P3G5_HYPAI|nr:uncharacterized protein TRIATDRAFT_300937 [Trichoderma atroviride IMI 206040]EHK42924.1 hypothetical protein TRIATDRAFT_300937 [Trichoderma atroviride IMI 206040]